MTYIPERLRLQVVERAGQRCEYCKLRQADAYFSHEVDHIYAEKHGGQAVENNLALACSICNRHKGSDICSLDWFTSAIVPLFHPRHDYWVEHFTVRDDGILQPLTPTGRVTEHLLQFNTPILIKERETLVQFGIYRLP